MFIEILLRYSVYKITRVNNKNAVLQQAYRRANIFMAVLTFSFIADLAAAAMEEK